jgi:preprotein translocase subunit YajC
MPPGRCVLIMENVELRQLLPPLLFMIAVLVFFWFMIIRPTKQRQKQHSDLVKSLENGDHVVTAGGIYGTVVQVREQTVKLKVADGVVMTMDRRAVRRRQSEEAEK